MVLSRFILCGVVFLNSFFVPALVPSAQNKPSADAELQVYKQWYDAFKERNLPQAIKLGEAYLQRYPNGKFGGYIRQIINFARVATDRRNIAQANANRELVQTSLADSSPELDSLLKEVIDGRADVNAKTGLGQTALMYVAANGQPGAVKILLEKKPDLNITENSHGWTALIYAIWSGDRKVVRSLLEAYPDADVKDKQGRTALDHAILTADFELMLLIVGRPMRGISS
jgi:hypothetical protein